MQLDLIGLGELIQRTEVEWARTRDPELREKIAAMRREFQSCVAFGRDVTIWPPEE